MVEVAQTKAIGRGRRAEVGLIPKEWTISDLGKCLISPPDYGINAPAVDFTDKLPAYIRITDIAEDGRFSPEKPVSVNSLDTERYFLNEGELVFARTGATVGKSYLYNPIDGKLVFAGYLIRVRPNPAKLLPSFLSAYVTTGPYWDWVSVMSMRSGQPGINASEYAQLPVPLPPLVEQRAIAAALSDAAALIASLDNLIAKKRDIKTAAMQQLLTGKKRLPGFSGKWEGKKLGEVAQIQRGASPRPIDSPIWFDENSSIGWVRISDVTRSGMYLRETTQRLSALGVQHSRPVNRGNLIMSICATVGRPIITDIDACIHDGFVVFDNPRADKHFLYFILQSIESGWSRYGQTGSQMNLNTGLISRTEIALPGVAEQTDIADVLCDMDAEIDALEARREKTKTLREGMMQQLLTGNIRLI